METDKIAYLAEVEVTLDDNHPLISFIDSNPVKSSYFLFAKNELDADSKIRNRIPKDYKNLDIRITIQLLPNCDGVYKMDTGFTCHYHAQYTPSK